MKSKIVITSERSGDGYWIIFPSVKSCRDFVNSGTSFLSVGEVDRYPIGPDINPKDFFKIGKVLEIRDMKIFVDGYSRVSQRDLALEKLLQI